jgi:hypothetical protein
MLLKLLKKSNMERIEFQGTWGYEDFITIDEQSQLLEWVYKNEQDFHILAHHNETFKHRKCYTFKTHTTHPYPLIQTIKQRVINVESIGEWAPEPRFFDYIGYISEGGAIHRHKDKNELGYIHVRYNVILSWPEEGGDSIYGDSINTFQERTVWRCEAGNVPHASTEVKGSRPRITLSLGFQIKE